MEFKCKCGHMVEDEADGQAHKAKIMTEDAFDAYSDQVDVQINEFIVAIMSGKRDEWMDNHFLEGYPRDLTNAQMLGDVLNWMYLGNVKDVFQCENCGRLWIEKDGVNMSFMPEEDGVSGILGE